MKRWMKPAVLILAGIVRVAAAFLPAHAVSPIPRARARLCAQQEIVPEIVPVSLPKPLGLALEEVAQDEAKGVLCSQLLPDGSAAASGAVWPGDVLLYIGEKDVQTATFEETMDALLAAPSPVDLVFGRLPGRVASVKFPDGSMAFGAPREPLARLARRAKFRPLYSCGEGLCGSCELRVARGDGPRQVRICTGVVPKAGGEFELAWPEGAGPDGWQ